jgi:hypothetical protein
VHALPTRNPAVELSAALQKMRVDWNERARLNAKHYVQDEKVFWKDRDFFRSGEISVAKLVMTDMGRSAARTTRLWI